MVVLRSRRRRWRGIHFASDWRLASPGPWAAGLVLGAGLAPLLAGPLAAQTGPVLCTTTLEAPLVRPDQPLAAGSAPREVTRCGVVGTVSDLVRKRYYSYRAPFARGVDITHQITDFFGLAMGGGDGTKLMGLGFPDQAIMWDATAIENTNRFLMDQQVHLVPRRTADLATPYTTSVRTTEGGGTAPLLAYPEASFDPR